jgi:hypothetical protein
VKRIFHVQYTGIYTVSIDEQGSVTMQSSVERHLHDQDTVILEPEEAYNLLHFLSGHRDLLVKAITVRQEARNRKEPRTDSIITVQHALPTPGMPLDGSHLNRMKSNEPSSAG